MMNMNNYLVRKLTVDNGVMISISTCPNEWENIAAVYNWALKYYTYQSNTKSHIVDAVLAARSIKTEVVMHGLSKEQAEIAKWLTIKNLKNDGVKILNVQIKDA